MAFAVGAVVIAIVPQGGSVRLWLVVGGDQKWLKNEVICVNLRKINNVFL